MTLSHYSTFKYLTPYSVAQGGAYAGLYKPNGLWVSVDGDDDWPHWCDNNYACGEHRFVVTLDINARVLTIDNSHTLMQFHEQYWRASFRNQQTIDWGHVAAEWQGIVIAPYQWSHRLDPRMLWYYGWDCASGVIWDAGAISECCLTERIT